MGKTTKFHMVQFGLRSASFYFLQCCIDLTKTKQWKFFLILILYDENAKKTCFWFLYPRWLKSKNTVQKCVNITLGMVKDITLTFCSIHELFIRDIRFKFKIPKTKYWAKLRRGYFRVWDFCLIPYKQKLSYWQFVTSNDIDIKVEPLIREIGQHQKQ